MQIWSVMTSLFATKMWKILNKRYLWKYWSSVLETWHHKCASKKKQNDTLVLLPWQQFCRWCCVNKNCNSRFCFKTRTIYPTQSNDGTKDNMGTISVPSRTLCPTVEVANGDFFAFWQKETGAKRVAMETALRVSFCFFCDVHLWCQVSRTLLQYFQRYRLFSIFHILVANNMTSSLIKFA